MRRVRDFGCEQPYAIIKKEKVAVSTTVFSDGETLTKLRKKNKEHLLPWTAMPVTIPNNEHYQFTIRYKELVVGELVFWGFGPEDSTKCYVSFWVDEDHQNLGICTTALALSCEHLFENYMVDIIDAAIQPNNFRSIAVVEKLGFQKTKSIDDFLRVGKNFELHDIYTLRRK